MRIRQAFTFAIAAAALICASAEAREIRNVPVVTQIQGVTFYRTSITISNGNPTNHDTGGNAVLVPIAGGRELSADDADAQPRWARTGSASSTTSSRRSRTPGAIRAADVSRGSSERSS